MKSLFLFFIAAFNILKIDASSDGMCVYVFSRSLMKETYNETSYSCMLHANINKGEQLIITGDHLYGNGNSRRSDDDIDRVQIAPQHTIQTIDGTIFNKFKNIKEFQAHHSGIEEITADAFVNCEKLEKLILPGNKIKELKANLLGNCKNLKELDLMKNDDLILKDNDLVGAESLEKFYFSSNSSNSLPARIFQNARNLNFVILRFDNLAETSNLREALNDAKNIQTMRFQCNNLETFDFEIFNQMEKLKELRLTMNGLKFIPENSFPQSMEYLSIVGLNLMECDENSFNGLINLHKLHIKSTSIVELPSNILNPLVNLNELTIFASKLKQLHADTFVNNLKLEKLYLSKNELEELQENLFAPLKNLKTLRLSSNKIKTLNLNSFGQINSIVSFSIDKNLLEKIQPGFFGNFPNLTDLNVKGNLCVGNNEHRTNDLNNLTALSDCYKNWENSKKN